MAVTPEDDDLDARLKEYWKHWEQKQKSIRRLQSTDAEQKRKFKEKSRKSLPRLVHTCTEDHPSPADCVACIAVERGEINFSSTLNPYAHECVDRPRLLCPACEWATRHEKAEL
jgi:hypothetical protein